MKKISFLLCSFLASVTLFAGELTDGYEKVTDISSLTSSDKVILYCDESEVGVSGFSGYKDANVSSDASDWVQYEVTPVSGGVLLYDPNAAQYIIQPGGNSFLYGTSNSMTCNISNGVFGGLDGTTQRYLCRNEDPTNGTFHRFYPNTNSTATTNKYPFYIYKIIEETPDIPIETDALQYTITGTNPNTAEVSGYTGHPTNIIIPETVTINEKTYRVTSIGTYAFYGCSGLTSVTIPESVTSIGNYAFMGCSALTSVIWNAKNCADPYLSYSSYFSGISSQIKSFTFGNDVEHIPAYLCKDMSKLTSITIPESVTSIGNYAFSNCSGLTSVTIPNSVTSIGESAFSYCYGLTSVTIPNSVTSIGNSAFSDCSGLTSVTIPNSVTSIGNNAFRDCSGLTSVTIPNSVTSIGFDAFSGCSALTSVIWNAKNYADDPYSSYFSSIRSQITSFTFGNEVEHIPAYLCKDMSKLTSITIPESVTSIGEWAFKGCTGITAITWNAKHGANVYASGDAPFYDIRKQITSFTFGNEVEYIPAYLCFNMPGLTSITIPNSVTAIGKWAFAGASGITSVTIPESVTSLGIGVFQYTPITTITIPRNVKEFGLAMFYRCDNLTSIIVEEGNSVFDSRNDCNAIVETATNTLVAGCSKSTILNSITGLRPYAFYGCNGLKSVTLPSSITTIGKYAFFDCEQLSEIHCAAKLPPRIVDEDGNIMSNNAPLVSDYNAVTLYVPCESQAAYYTHANWGLFNTIECMDENKYTVSILYNTDEGTVVGAGTYTEGTEVTLAAIPNKGYEFVQWSDGNKDNPRKIVVTGDVNLAALFAKEHTAIDDAVSDQPAASKTIRNGQVCILRDGKVYDIMGNQIQ